MASGRGPLGAILAAMHRPVYAARMKELTRLLVPHLRANDRMLDVGCGGGMFGRALMDASTCPRGVVVTGLERFKRGGEPIEVIPYDGVTIPFADRSFDVVLLADVLHHEEDPDRLLRECTRVTSRLLIVKDVQLWGPLAWSRISFIDWAANEPYGVKCLYRYNTPTQWAAMPARFGFRLQTEINSIDLYPAGYNLLFGKRLQYMGVWEVGATVS